MKMRRNRCVWAAAGLASALLAATAKAADWPGWRGTNGDGNSPESSGWPGGWPPERLWTANVGHGCTSPIIVGGRLYVLGWTGEPAEGKTMGVETLHAFEARTGRTLWRREMPGRYQGRHAVGDEGEYGGPLATPLADREGGRLFTLSPDGDLRAWRLDDGEPLWHVNLYDTERAERRPDVGGARQDYGYTASPRLHRGWLLVETGGADGLLAAFDPATGARRWVSEARAPAGHSGAPAVSPDGDALAVLALDRLVLMDLRPDRAGRTLAELPWATDYGCNIPTPAFRGRRLFVTSGYNRRRTAALDRSDDGALTERWSSRAHAVVSSPVVRGDRVYVLAGSVAALDAETGAIRWRGGRFGHGSMIATADDRLLVWGEGRLALLDAAPAATAYRELQVVENVLPATAYPHVALSDGVIACKDRDGNLAVFSVAPRRGGGAP